MNELVVDASQLTSEPFNLELGAGIVCRIRSSNSNGWGEWSISNAGVSLANCASTADGEASVPTPNSPENCECRPSCKATGCGGCCSKKNGTFWSDLAKKACCKTGTCGGCASRSTPDTKHRHKYCHVHADEKNRKRLVTNWTVQTRTKKQEVLKPFRKTVKRLKLVPRKKTVSRVRMVPQTKKETKTVLRNELKMVDEIVMVPFIW